MKRQWRVTLTMSLAASLCQGQESSLEPMLPATCTVRYTDGLKTSATPTYTTKAFSYTLTQPTRLAKGISATPTTTYAPPFAEVSHLASNQSTTIWGNWELSGPNATDTSNPYGNAAWSALWTSLNPANFTRGLYTTTVEPTPVPTSELIAPPARYFAPENACLEFPKDFIFGVSGASAQIEGAIADEGRSPSVPDLIPILAAADPNFIGASEIAYDYVAIENYYLYKQDIERLAAVGVKAYSFSIAWTRVLPFVYPGTPVNQQAIDHYGDLIDFIISKGMKPIVTLFHWETPLQFYGGTANSLAQHFLSMRTYYGFVDLRYGDPAFEDAFVNFAQIVMTNFASKVPVWVTFNEPQVGIVSGPALYTVLHAHARIHHFYHDQINGTGQITMKSFAGPGTPLDPGNSSHVAATEHYNDLYIGALFDPLVHGYDYPQAFKDTIQDYVPLSDSDRQFLNGTLDIVSVDYYTVAVVEPAVFDLAQCGRDNSTDNKFYPSCVSQGTQYSTGWQIGSPTAYLGIMNPILTRQGLNYLWSRYGKPIILSEFGTADFKLENSAGGLASGSVTVSPLAASLYDTLRSDYLISYMNEILKAIWEDGVEVVGALAWSFADNWEWGTFDHKLGMQAVNRTTQAISYKRSMFDYVDFYQSHGGR